jgi:hypothetical protein
MATARDKLDAIIAAASATQQVLTKLRDQTIVIKTVHLATFYLQGTEFDVGDWEAKLREQVPEVLEAVDVLHRAIQQPVE